MRAKLDRMGLLVLLVITVACSSVSARLAVMSIDLGGEYMKIALVKPGVPMEIVLNKESSRKTPTIVAFRDGERHFSSQAENTALKFPEKSVGYLMQVVGRQFDDPHVQLYKKRFPFYTLLKDEERGTVLFKIDEDTTYSTEELLAMILEKAKEYAQDFAEQEVTDAVITVPPFYNQAERRAVLTAAKLVGINVLQLMSDNAAVALNYGIFRRKNFNSTTQYYMFYDMGSTSTTATIVGYTVVKTKEGTRMESNPQLTIKGVGFDRTLGGLEFTLRLRSHLAEAFNKLKKTPLKVEESHRAMAKLLKESERVKKVLSANVEHHAQVENLIDEKDLRIAVSRAELEKLTKDLTDRVTKPIEEALRVSDITVPEISEVILMGGGTRSPKVQELLMKYLGRTELGKSINTDEAAALGAVYQAAYLGKGFKVKKFGVRESNIYPINVEFEKQKSDDDGDDKSRVIKRTLFGRMNPYPQKKVMTFNKHSKDFSFNIVYNGLEFLTEEDRKSFGNPLISRYQLTGVADALSKNKDKAEAKGIKAHFQMDGSGILQLDRVESVFEKNDTADAGEKSAWSKIGSAIGGLFGGSSDDEPKVEDSQEPQETPSGGAGDGEEDTATKDGGADDGAGADGTTAEGGAGADDGTAADGGESDGQREDPSDENSARKEEERQDQEAGEGEDKAEEEGAKKDEKTEDTPGDEEEKKKEEEKTDESQPDKTNKSDKKEAKEKPAAVVSIKELIQVVAEVLDVKDVAEDKFKASKKRLADLKKADHARVELEKSKNELEAFIFDFQDKLSQGPHQACSTDTEREALSALLEETSDWLYEHSDEAKKSEFKEKLKALKDKTLPIAKRVYELEERPKALDALKEILNQTNYFLATVKNFTTLDDPILTQVEMDTLEKLINETKQWRDETLSAQKKLKPSEDPVLVVEDVGQKIMALERERVYLINKIKNYRPKAKPKDEKSKDENVTKSQDSTNTTTDIPSSEEGDLDKEGEEGTQDTTADETLVPDEQQEKPKSKKSKRKEKQESEEPEEVLELVGDHLLISPDAADTDKSKADKQESNEAEHTEL